MRARRAHTRGVVFLVFFSPNEIIDSLCHLGHFLFSYIPRLGYASQVLEITVIPTTCTAYLCISCMNRLYLLNRNTDKKCVLVQIQTFSWFIDTVTIGQFITRKLRIVSIQKISAESIQKIQFSSFSCCFLTCPWPWNWTKAIKTGMNVWNSAEVITMQSYTYLI